MTIRTAFLGSKSLGLATLRALRDIHDIDLRYVLSFDDTHDDRNVFHELQMWAKEQQLPFVSLPATRTERHATLREILCLEGIDLVIVCGWYELIPNSLLPVPKHGFVGIHASDLPNYKGSSPIVWALIDGVEKLGVSLFGLRAKIDDGPVFAKTFVSGRDRYIADVLQDIEKTVPTLLQEGVKRILSGDGIPLPDVVGTHCLVRTPDDGQIDWHDDALAIMRFIRAQSAPYPGAFFHAGDRRYFVHKCELAREETKYRAVPGSVLSCKDDQIVVICGDGKALRLSDVHATGNNSLHPLTSIIKPKTTRLT